MLRIISECILGIDEELCAYFIDWQKFDHVNRTKLMKVLKGIGINWHERRLVSKLYMDQSVKVQVVQGKARSVKTGRGVRQGCCQRVWRLQNRTSNSHLVLLATEGTVLQDLIGRLIETVRRYGKAKNVEKIKVMRILRQSSPVQIMIDQKQLENVEQFHYLGIHAFAFCNVKYHSSYKTVDSKSVLSCSAIT
jgi:hypothetical protein